MMQYNVQSRILLPFKENLLAHDFESRSCEKCSQAFGTRNAVVVTTVNGARDPCGSHKLNKLSRQDISHTRTHQKQKLMKKIDGATIKDDLLK